MSAPAIKDEPSESLKELQLTLEGDFSTELENAAANSTANYEDPPKYGTGPESSDRTNLYNLDSINQQLSSPTKLASASPRALMKQDVSEPLHSASEFRGDPTNQDTMNMPLQQTCLSGCTTSTTQHSPHVFPGPQFPVEQRQRADIPSRLWGREDSSPYEYHISNPNETANYHMNGKPAEMVSNPPWMPPVYQHAVPLDYNGNGYGVRMQYCRRYYPYHQPPYPHDAFPHCPPPPYYPDGRGSPRGVPPPQYMQHEGMPMSRCRHNYMDSMRPGMVTHPSFMSRDYMNNPPPPPSFMSRDYMNNPPPPPSFMSREYMNNPLRPHRGSIAKHQTPTKVRNSHMTSLIVDGRELNYNWPPPQTNPKTSQDVRSARAGSEAAGDVEEAAVVDHSQKQMTKLTLSPPCAAVTTPSIDAMRGSIVGPAGNDASDTTNYSQGTESALEGAMSTERQMEQIHGMCASAVADKEYTPRQSKISKTLGKATYDMLQEAMKEKPDKAVKIAKTLFSKRMLTLYGWLYPATAKRDIKNSIDKLWDRLPLKEKEFYMSQAVDRFGSRATGVMVNPQLAALPGLSDDLHFGPAGHESRLHIETEAAVRNLIATQEAQAARPLEPPLAAQASQEAVPVTPQTRTKRTRAESTQPTGDTEEHKKRRHRRARKNRTSSNDTRSSVDGDTNEQYQDDTSLESSCEDLTSSGGGHGMLDAVSAAAEYDDAASLDLRMLSYPMAACGEVVEYTSDEIYAESEVVLSSGGTEVISSDVSYMGGLDMLGLIAEHELDVMRRHTEQFDNKWYFPSLSQEVYSSSDLLEEP